MSEDAPHYGPMTEQRAREILGARIDSRGQLYQSAEDSIMWPDRPTNTGGVADPLHVFMEGTFTADELEAIAWWMRNMPGEPSRLERAFAAEPQRSIVDAALRTLDGVPASIPTKLDDV